MARITMKDVAEKAGVSKSTVSQYLNGRFEYMGDETKQRIQAAVEELGYRPNYVARSLKQKRTSMIGVIVANIVHRFSTEVSRAIEDLCHENDIHAIVCNADDNPGKEKKYIEMLRAKQVDGMIIFPTGENEEIYRNMVEEKYPVVFMDRKIEDMSIDTVVVNNTEAACNVVRHLIERGHERVGFVSPPLLISTRRERLEGYRKALSEQGISIHEHDVKNSEIQEMQRELRKMFDQPSPPTALFAANDLVLLEVLRFIKENRMDVPDELALIVFDNIPYAELMSPTLTTVRQPAFEMGKYAAQLLVEKIEKTRKAEPTAHVFDAELIIRESSGDRRKVEEV